MQVCKGRVLVSGQLSQLVEPGAVIVCLPQPASAPAQPEPQQGLPVRSQPMHAYMHGAPLPPTKPPTGHAAGPHCFSHQGCHHSRGTQEGHRGALLARLASSGHAALLRQGLSACTWWPLHKLVSCQHPHTTPHCVLCLPAPGMVVSCQYPSLYGLPACAPSVSVSAFPQQTACQASPHPPSQPPALPPTHHRLMSPHPSL